MLGVGDLPRRPSIEVFGANSFDLVPVASVVTGVHLWVYRVPISWRRQQLCVAEGDGHLSSLQSRYSSCILLAVDTSLRDLLSQTMHEHSSLQAEGSRILASVSPAALLLPSSHGLGKHHFWRRGGCHLCDDQGC